MKSKQIYFFSELSDIEPIFIEIESLFNLQYYKSGLLDLSDIPNFNSYSLIPNIGFVTHGDWNHNESYLILSQNKSVNVREVIQRDGSSKYAIDQKVNQESIILKIGGIYKENIIVGGSIGTICNDEFSNTLFTQFSKLIRKRFSKVETFYVGNNAKAKLESGWRLVTDDRSPVEYDLKL